MGLYFSIQNAALSDKIHKCGKNHVSASVHQVERVTPANMPKSASFLNFIRLSPNSPTTPLPRPVCTQRLRTLVMLASRGWRASSALALLWTTSGRILFRRIARRCSRSFSNSATVALLRRSLRIAFRLPGETADTCRGRSPRFGTTLFSTSDHFNNRRK
jgi:hypothetical protein